MQLYYINALNNKSTFNFSSVFDSVRYVNKHCEESNDHIALASQLPKLVT